jgi:ubiquinone/menaquinone biosynthesis C-methylase UbiE
MLKPGGMGLDNFEEYADPVLYDKENENYQDDVDFLRRWVDGISGPIIDLACGTGRATIPLAIEGHELIGVDVHRGMLEEAKRKSGQLPVTISWVEQDCTDLFLNVSSAMIFCVGNSFQHFLTNENQDSLLRSVNRHLVDGGLFIFDTRFPNSEELLQPSTKEYWKTYEDKETNSQVAVYTISSYDSLNQIQHYTTIREFLNHEKEIVKETRSNIKLRYVYPKEMERLLKTHGFEIINVFGGWDESPITNLNSQMIYVCRKGVPF